MIKRTARGERGQALLMASFVVAFAMVVAALVLDLGRMWIIKARLQAASDAATLAAVQHTRIAVRKTAQPQVATQFFSLDENLPPAQDIVKKEPVYKPGPNGTMVLVGYNVTWITAYKEQVANYWAEIDPQEALSEAWNVLVTNAWHWAQADQGGDVVIPQMEQGSADASGTSATCRLKVRADVPSLLVGPVMKLFGKGNGDNPDITVRVESESTANVAAKS